MHQSPKYRIASTLQLPPGSWPTVLDCLCAHFSHIPREQWLSRMARGRVLDAEGGAVTTDTVYRVGLTIRYFRELEAEPEIPFTESIVYADTNIVVADKPHFLPVTPKGKYVTQCLLARLIERLDTPQLAPLHRIDRGTAGLVMFSVNPKTRAQYHALFAERKITKHYQAVAPALPSLEFPRVHRSRMEGGEPFFRMQEVPGVANSETYIDVLEGSAANWRYALMPITGKKHQLRVHMASLGAGIINDEFYPTLIERAPDDYSQPLKLLAASLEFIDPVDGRRMRFDSELTL
jgi:tRNA pseudouridine32 synthase/23S rRNA pseudouridine746 synthase